MTQTTTTVVTKGGKTRTRTVRRGGGEARPAKTVTVTRTVEPYSEPRSGAAGGWTDGRQRHEELLGKRHQELRHPPAGSELDARLDELRCGLLHHLGVPAARELDQEEGIHAALQGELFQLPGRRRRALEGDDPPSLSPPAEPAGPPNPPHTCGRALLSCEHQLATGGRIVGGTFGNTGFLVFVLVLLAAVPGAAQAAFPGSDPNESVGSTPRTTLISTAASPTTRRGPDVLPPVRRARYERFGFAPNGSQVSALYHNPLDPHVSRYGRRTLSRAAIRSARCPACRRTAPGSTPPAPPASSWRSSTRASGGTTRPAQEGRPQPDELPLPQDGGRPCAQYDCNRDGAFNVDDYANDPRSSNGGRRRPRPTRSSMPAT